VRTDRSLASDATAGRERDARLATAIREALDQGVPEIGGIELSWERLPAPEPALAGGGLYDAFELPDRRVLLLAGGVRGGGVPAVVLAAAIRSAVRALAIDTPSPRYVLEAVNRLLLQERREQAVDAALLLLDPRTGQLQAAAAGSPTPIRLGGGRPQSLVVTAGPPLGGTGSVYPVCRINLAADDTLVLYADGRRPSGREGLPWQSGALERSSAAEPVGEHAGRLLRALPGLDDPGRWDAVVVMVRLTCVERRSEREITLAAPLAPWRLGEIRRAVRTFLLGHELPGGVADDLVLCVEEACTNVIRHSGGGTPGRLSVTVDERGVEVVVKDEGRGFGMVLPDPRVPPDPLAGGGRGLYLMSTLSDEIELWNEGGACVRLRRSTTGPARLCAPSPSPAAPRH